jgi:hypothetical protein
LPEDLWVSDFVIGKMVLIPVITVPWAMLSTLLFILILTPPDPVGQSTYFCAQKCIGHTSTYPEFDFSCDEEKKWQLVV